LLPTETNNIFHGFSIGEELETGWLYRNGSAELLSLQLSTEGDLLTGVDKGTMTVSVHTDANFAISRYDNFLLPVLTFGIVDGEMTDGYDIFGDTVVGVADSTFQPAPEQEKSYMNWGKWSATVVDPNSIERQTRTVNGLWIATNLEQTDLTSLQNEVGDMVLGGDFSGTYSGDAHCIRNGTVGMDGTSFFTVDFRDQTFTGEFDFSSHEVGLRYAGVVNDDGSVQGNCTGVSGETVDTSKSLIEGALFDNAKVIGTSWNAKTTTNSYIGVAAGTGTIRPIASEALQTTTD
jgi:hypothetical protein